MQPALYIVGALCELLGIVLIAAPDLVPGAKRVGRWIRLRWRTVENRARRSLGLSPRGRVFESSAAITARGRFSAKGTVGHVEDAPLEEKVEYLMRRDQAAQETAHRITERVEALEAESRQSVEDLRREVEALIETELRAAQEDFQAIRIGGTIALATGLALTTLGNFA